MKKLLVALALGLSLLASEAVAQCSGVFQPNTACGVGAAESARAPHQIPATSLTTGLVVGTTTITGGTSKGILYNNAGVLGNTNSSNSGVLVTNSSGVPSISGIVPSLATAGNFQFQDGTIAGFIGPANALLTNSFGLGTLNNTPVAFFQNNTLAGSITAGTSGPKTSIFGDGLVITPVANTLRQGFNVTQSATSALSCPAPGAGPPTEPIFFGCAYNSIFINPNNVDGNGGVVHGLSVQMFNSGANVTQSSTAFFANYTYGTAATTATDRVAISGLSQIDSNQGGTGTASGDSKGSVVATNFYAIAGNNFTFGYGINGMEMNITARVGSNVYAKNGISIVLQSDDAVQATSVYSVAYSLSSQGGSVNWKCGYCANDLNGQAPITATGTLFGTIGSGTMGTGVDISSYTSTNAFKSPGVTIAGGTGGGNLATNTGITLTDGTITSVFQPSTSAGTATAIGSTSAHGIAFIASSVRAGFITSAGIWNIGVAGTLKGQMGFSGNTSGTGTIVAQAAMGSPTWTLPTNTGTFAVTASSPIVLSATTGDLTCPTCNVSAATVTSITPGNGLTSTLTATAPGSVITTSGTLSTAQLVNAQTGTSYAILDGDRAKLITASNSSAQAYTIAQAGASSAFQAGWFVDVQNYSTVNGIVTITPTTSTIAGASTYKVMPGQRVRVVSDGTNYQVQSITAAQISGTTTNDNANVGNLGEYFAPTCNNLALTTATDINCTSQSLTAGDWEASAVCYYVPAATTTVTLGTCSFNTVTTTVNTALGTYARDYWSNNTHVPNTPITIIIPNYRISLSATTTYYLNANMTFGTSTAALYGIGHFRRAR